MARSLKNIKKCVEEVKSYEELSSCIANVKNNVEKGVVLDLGVVDINVDDIDVERMQEPEPTCAYLSNDGELIGETCNSRLIKEIKEKL